MRHLDERCDPVEMAFSCLRMDFDQRQRARSRVLATNGEYVGVHIKRGTSLKDGDHLRSSDGKVFVVRAKREPLSVVECDRPLDLIRAAYHLGNRHVRVQVTPSMVCYQTDHVIDAMLEGLGLSVSHADLPFEPEPGAYHRHGRASQHAHGHSHSHGHSHPHSHSHDQHRGDHEHSELSAVRPAAGASAR